MASLDAGHGQRNGDLALSKQTTKLKGEKEMKPTDSKVIAEKMIRYLDAALPIKSAAHQNLKSEL